MADLKVQLEDINTAFSNDVRDIATSIAGDPKATNATVIGALTTVAKNFIGAINELKTGIDNVDLTSLIDDILPTDTTTYSSNRIEAYVTAQIAGVLEGEDLSDIADQVAANAAADASLLGFGATQTLTNAQKTQGQTNLGLGDLVSFDMAADYITKRNA